VPGVAENARKGLLVDWGGVMTSSVFDAFEAFGRAEGLDATTVRTAFATDPSARELLGDYERGSLAGPDFERRFAALLGVREHEGLVGRLFAGLRQDRRMQDAVAAFRRAGVRTGLLSNSWGTGESYDRERFDELFDVLVVSGELGVRKPEEAIYAIAAERMALPPEDLVFVDDLPGNLKPARALGMATVVHRDADTTLAELEELLGVRLPAAG
jgi:epoxide hydrolase-like predicted phosphatase